MLNFMIQFLQATILSPWQSNENFVSRKIQMQHKMHQDPMYRPRSNINRAKLLSRPQTNGKTL
jgi:hypothetical protein